VSLCHNAHIDKYGLIYTCERYAGHRGMHQEVVGTVFKARYRWHNSEEERRRAMARPVPGATTAATARGR
jgi:hypothetical protein